MSIQADPAHPAPLGTRPAWAWRRTAVKSALPVMVAGPLLVFVLLGILPRPVISAVSRRSAE